MSQNLENLFKESLQNSEAPYNPQAWDALQARLDAAMPVATPKKPFNPWRASAVVIGVVGITAALYFLINSSAAIENQKVETEIAKEKTTPAKEIETIKSIHSSNEVKTSTKESTKIEPTSKIQDSKKSSASTQNVSSPSKKAELNAIEELKMNDATTINSGMQTPKRSENIISIYLPIIDKHCVNDDVKIANDNARDLILISPSGKRQTISANKSASIQVKEAGIYRLTDTNEEKESTFIVNAQPEPYFDLDLENIYKNGVPSTLAKTNSIANNYKWTTDQSKTVFSGKENEFHFFNKGTHEITLETTDNNGCTNSTSRTVSIKEDYNLMAADAFSPMSNDPRKNTFMPFALKERNTGFTLTIMDPKSGLAVFTTKNSTEGWDGIDRRNGNQAESGANYIWKVILTNPLPGEADSYKGIVIVAK